MVADNSTLEKAIPLWLACLPIAVLIFFLGLSVYFFSDSSSSGANQIALILSSAVASLVAIKQGFKWQQLEQAVIQGISHSMIAILILLVVGSLIGSWMLSGTVPALIYYGLHLFSAQWFFAAACLACAISALSIGSSWTVAGTLGVAFMGMAVALNINLAITAGAVVSGAYFGDKLSPLSDTTNLASAVTGTPLFRHIHHLLWTTVPTFMIAMVIFLLLGFGNTSAGENTVQETLDGLEAQFHIAWYLLLPVALVFVLAWRRVPALPTLLMGALFACILALLFQQGAIGQFVKGDDLTDLEKSVKAIWMVLFDGYSSASDNQNLDSLLSRGGMGSMLNTVWLIICAMTFGSIMEYTGLLQRILRAVLNKVESATGLIISTVFTCIGANVMTADQYISIVLPGRMYKLEYARFGLASENLSRTIEDSATLTSPLVPWNTCGAYMAATLGVSTMSYLPYAFFNILGPVICIAFAVTHFRITPLDDTKAA